MNEKKYMSVEETNRMFKEENGIEFLINDETVRINGKRLAREYKGKNLVPTTEGNRVGIMTAPISFLKDKLSVPGYLVYTTNEEGKIQKFGVIHLQFRIALCIAKEFYISQCVTNNLINSKNGKEPSHSEFIKAYSEMSEKYREKEEKHIRIRRRDR